MKTTLRILCGILSALLLATAASAATPGMLAKPLTVVPDGMKVLPVTSSVSDDTEDTSVLFDGDAATGVTMTFDENSVTYTFTIRTATGLPSVLSAVALIGTAKEGNQMNFKVSGTNDNTEQTWNPIMLRSPVVAVDSWRVFNISEPDDGWKNAPRYSFYKIEISEAYGADFTITELLLISPDLGEAEMTYATVEVVEEGETPPIVPVQNENTLPRKLRWGLFFPGFMK